jgi:formylglycine-generating enzyme required for sulfatase activity
VIVTLIVVTALLMIVSPASAAQCPDAASMAQISAGEFWMGSDRAERRLAFALSSTAVRSAGWFDAELSRRRMRTGAFCIERRLVTQADYSAFVRTSGHRAPGISREAYLDQGFLVHEYEEVKPYLWHGGEPPLGRQDHPVVLVSAADAEAYCRWRYPAGWLPTEAEWERAARGGDGRIFPWGNRWDPERLNSAERGPRGTTPANRDRGGASPYELLDAVGNVFQWTASSLADGRRVLKGCAWDDEAGLCRPAFRHGRPALSRHILIGFRCSAAASPAG